VAILDQYDKEKKVGLIVDEWGTWFDVEPGTNPGFLYQQSTMRDALVAGINLNIFNKHCDRVRMANIAQLVNVLQSVILTDGEKMIKTPTYHVFNMYKYHQDAELLSSSIETERIGTETDKVPNLTESVSLGKDGKIHVTITNLSVTEDYDICGEFTGTQILGVKGEILTNEMRAHNTFDAPETVHTESFDGCKVDGTQVSFTIPACSVLHLALTV
jgi:alpha-N-arabinofuranosidase